MTRLPLNPLPNSRHFLQCFAAVCIAVGACGAACRADERPKLKDAFAGDFLMGVAVSIGQVTGEEPVALALVTEQFNAITSETLFKWGDIHPEPGQYNFDYADDLVEYGEANGMFIVGHNLIWQERTPDWVFVDDLGNDVDRETLLARMREHIHTVVGRYRGRVDAWDVVNEALEEDGSIKQTRWQQIIGDDYIEKAFEYAHEADPAAELYYNDYTEWTPEKRRGYNALVRNLQNKGIRIDGIGLQGHWGLTWPTVDEIDAMFQDYGKLGVKLMVTELDIDLLPRPSGSEENADLSQDPALKQKLDPYADGLPDDVQQALTKRYAEIFACFMRHRDKIDRVTFWGVQDGLSWLNEWPMAGRTAYPLLFDRQFEPKPAFDAVLRTAEQSQ